MEYPIPPGYTFLRIEEGDSAYEVSKRYGYTETLWDKLCIAQRFYRGRPNFAEFRARIPWMGVIDKMMKDGGPSCRPRKLVLSYFNEEENEELECWLRIDCLGREKYERSEFNREYPYALMKHLREFDEEFGE